MFGGTNVAGEPLYSEGFGVGDIPKWMTEPIEGLTAEEDAYLKSVLGLSEAGVDGAAPLIEAGDMATVDAAEVGVSTSKGAVILEDASLSEGELAWQQIEAPNWVWDTFDRMEGLRQTILTEFPDYRFPPFDITLTSWIPAAAIDIISPDAFSFFLDNSGTPTVPTETSVDPSFSLWDPEMLY